MQRNFIGLLKTYEMYACACKIIAHAETKQKYVTPSGEHSYHFFSARCVVHLSEVVWFLKLLAFC